MGDSLIMSTKKEADRIRRKRFRMSEAGILFDCLANLQDSVHPVYRRWPDNRSLHIHPHRVPLLPICHRDVAKGHTVPVLVLIGRKLWPN